MSQAVQQVSMHEQKSSFEADWLHCAIPHASYALSLPCMKRVSE